MLEVDALLRGDLLELSNLQGAVVYRRVVEGRFRLIRRDGRVLARAEVKESDTGGLLLLGHSQLLETIQKTLINSSDHAFFHLAARFSEAVAAELPQPDEVAQLESPQLTRFRVQASRSGSALRPGDRLTLRAEGDPKLIVRVRLGKGEGFVPLSEAQPGVYVGEHVITPGEAWEGQLRATGSDCWGGGVELLTKGSWSVAARSLPAPSGLVAEREGERLVLRWEPVPGASAYAVHGLSGSAKPLARVEEAQAVLTLAQGPRALAVLPLDAEGRPGTPALVKEAP